MAQGQVAVDELNLDLAFDMGAESRAGSNAYIDPVSIQGIVKGNNWALFGMVAIVAASAVFIMRRGK